MAEAPKVEETKVSQEGANNKPENSSNSKATKGKLAKQKLGEEQIQALNSKLNEMTKSQKSALDEEKTSSGQVASSLLQQILYSPLCIEKSLKQLGKFKAEAFYPEAGWQERADKLKNAINDMIKFTADAEETALLLGRKAQGCKKEKETLTDENKQNTQLRSSLESYCRDVQDKNVKVQKINKSFVEEETKQREELIANLTKNVSDINEKVETQRKSAEELGPENEKMREQLKEKVQNMETREAELMEQVKQKDSSYQEKHSAMLGRLKNIEGSAMEVSRIKKETQEGQKRAQEAKFKLAIFSQKFTEYEPTFISSHQMLQRFRQEVERAASRLKTLVQTNKTLKDKTREVGALTVEIVQKDEEYKKRAQQENIKKDKIRARLTELNEELQKLKNQPKSE